LKGLYSSPVRVYLLLGALALAGIFAGASLPISLFPNSTKPKVTITVAYGSQTAEEFLNTFGRGLESQLRSITTPDAKVELVEGDYADTSVSYEIDFHWGVDPNVALREVQNAANGFFARLPQESRDSVNIYLRSRNSGFFAASFYSESRDLDSLYKLLEPILTPRLLRVTEAQSPVLWNPDEKEIRVELYPDTLASLQLTPREVEEAILNALGSRSGGVISSGGAMLQIQMPRQVGDLESLANLSIPTATGSVHLSEIARVDYGQKSMGSQIFKTNGASSLIVFASPKPGGNVKKMSEDIVQVIEEISPSLPADVQHRILVDPSEFIRSSVKNVLHEVGIAAVLAVIVLFLFIGSFRNVVTAAIEIPLSMVLAFLLMKLAGMNLNLISLGGLALAAGMNVDASVVVMENIFRHFEHSPGPHTPAGRLSIVVEAVKEVRFAVVASTIASLVVFMPLTFTSDLSYAILGDLALAVVFSHGFSAVVALILVPTIRLHLMNKEGGASLPRSPVEKQLLWLDETYAKLLTGFIRHSTVKWSVYAGCFALLVLLITVVLPRLPKEIVGTPDTDWLVLVKNTDGNTLVKHMELSAAEMERDLLSEFGKDIQYTFTQIENPNSGVIMARLKNKREMKRVWKALEARFTNTPTVNYWVGPWNPSELPLPNPPHMQIAVRGNNVKERSYTAQALQELLQEKKIYPRVQTIPNVEREKNLIIDPHLEQWPALRAAESSLTPGDLADILRVGTTGKRIGFLTLEDKPTDIILRYPQFSILTKEDIEAIPIGIASKLVPLKSLATIRTEEAAPSIFRRDEREVVFVEARENTGEEGKAAAHLVQAKAAVAAWQKEHPTTSSITFEEADKDLTTAIRQLGWAVGISVVLIFLVMLLQFGTLAEPILVLVSVPLGFIGVLVSLFVFQSTLSLNSILGVILLNGIAVANSILLVDFIKRLHESGMAPAEAAIEAARKRLRPILITSLTTVLGMLPIALGTGEGGRILQPLGIAVSGGLWVSMLLTLFLVPALHVTYLEWRHGGVRWQFRLPAFALKRRWTVWLFLLLLPASGHAMTFSEAVKTIVDRNPDVAIQRSTVAATADGNLSSRLGWLPTLSLEASHAKTDMYGLESTRQGVGGTASLNLFKFGADAAAFNAAGSEVATQEKLLEDTLIRTEAEAVATIATLLQGEMEVEVSKEILGTREEALEIARERYKRGLLAQQEVDKFSVDYDNAKARLSDSEVSLATSRADLEALLGNADVEREWPWKEILVKKKFEGLDYQQRPDWLAASEKVAAARSRRNEALGKLFPSLDLGLTYGYYVNRGGMDVTGTEWRGQIGVSIPIFDKFENLGSYRASMETEKIAEWQREKIKRVAKNELDSLAKSYDIAIATAQLRDKTMATSRRVYKDNLARFKRGLVSANDLFLDQDRLLDSQVNQIRGWASAHTTFAKLCQAAGRRLDACLGASLP